MSDRPFMKRIRHAFAVEDPEDFTPTELERAAAEKVCREIVRRRMILPTSMLLEMSRPLNYLGAQALHFFTPFASVLVDGRSWEDFASFVERRGSVEYLIRMLDDCEAAAKSDAEGSGSTESGSAAPIRESEDGPKPDSSDSDPTVTGNS